MFDTLILVGSGVTLFLVGYGLGLTKRPKGYIDYVRGVKDPTIKKIEVERRVEVILEKDSAMEALSEGERLMEKALQRRASLLLQWTVEYPNAICVGAWFDEARQLFSEANEIRLNGLAKLAIAQEGLKND